MSSILPETVPLHLIAKELGQSTHVLVAASVRGEFPPLVRVGRVWRVRRDLLTEWFGKQHATNEITPAQSERIRQAGQSEAGELRALPPLQPRANTAASS